MCSGTETADADAPDADAPDTDAADTDAADTDAADTDAADTRPGTLSNDYDVPELQPSTQRDGVQIHLVRRHDQVPRHLRSRRQGHCAMPSRLSRVKNALLELRPHSNGTRREQREARRRVRR